MISVLLPLDWHYRIDISTFAGWMDDTKIIPEWRSPGPVGTPTLAFATSEEAVIFKLRFGV